MYSYGPPHMAKQKRDDQLEHTYSNYVRIWDVVLNTCRRRWTIGRSGERGSEISVLAAQHDVDDDMFHHHSCDSGPPYSIYYAYKSKLYFLCNALMKIICSFVKIITHTHTHTHKFFTQSNCYDIHYTLWFIYPGDNLKLFDSNSFDCIFRFFQYLSFSTWWLLLYDGMKPEVADHLPCH